MNSNILGEKDGFLIRLAKARMQLDILSKTFVLWIKK